MSHDIGDVEIVLPEPDVALEQVAVDLLSIDPDGLRWATVVRRTFDMVYNGQQTGRYKWEQLMKTEKTHFGTLFEINAQREFEFDGGDSTDFRIAGYQVDAKWSQSDGGWMLPPEVLGEIALVGTGSDRLSTWSVGLVRVTTDVRRDGSNRDKKSQLSAAGRDKIRWLWRDAPLRPNVLLKLSEDAVARIFAKKHGTKKLDQLFREAEGMIVHRNAVATVSQQLDHQKRLRSNGGSRSSLQPEGYLILSGQYHRDLARAFGLPVPLTDEYISVRVVPSSSSEAVRLGGGGWRRAAPDEASPKPAPTLPSVKGQAD